MSTQAITKSAISESFKKLLRNVKISKISIDDICAAAQVSRKTFYRYFKDKYDLLAWTYDEDFCRHVEVKPEKSIWDYYPEICEYLYTDRQFFVNAYSFTGQNSFRDFCVGKLYRLIMNDFGDIFPDDTVSHFIVDRYCNAIFDGFVWWLSHEPCMTAEEYVDFSMNIVKNTANGIMVSFDKMMKK